MMSYAADQLADYLGARKRHGMSATNAIRELVSGSLVCVGSRLTLEQQLTRHADRAAALSGTTVRDMTSHDLAAAIRTHGLHRSNRNG